MGACLSSRSKHSTVRPPTAKVIAVDGSLKEYSVPVTASAALGHDQQICFLCNSDELYFDAHIPAIASEEPLQPGRIYFVLPIAWLEYPLTGTEMVALAVKASAALGLDSRNSGGRGSKVRVMPVLEVYEEVGDEETDGFRRFSGDVAVVLPVRSITVKKTGKKIGTRGRMERQPYKQGRLSTIEEADE